MKYVRAFVVSSFSVFFQGPSQYKDEYKDMIKSVFPGMEVSHYKDKTTVLSI